MSFLSGGSECAANANPLAQLSKRSDFDTSLQNSIRNGSNQQSASTLQHTANSFINANSMNQNDQNLMNRFMDQHHQLNNQNTFDFKPMSHELNNLQHPINLQPQGQNMHQQSQPSQNWSAEFISGSNSITSANSLNNISHSHQPQQHTPVTMNQMSTPFRYQPSFAFGNNRMLNNRMNTINVNTGTTATAADSQFNTLQTDDQSHLNKVDWEDQFKEIELQVDNPEIQVNELPSAFDEAAEFNTPLNFNEKYHESYQFEENNEFLNNPNAYEIGLKLMEGGAKLSEAALAFEAAAQENPKHVDAWLKLGQVQIQNEKELNGITALENSLLIDNKNLTALMSLAISYVNEGYDNAAFKTFENWIETKYPEVVSKARAENPSDTLDDKYSLNKRITNLFLKAAQLSPTGVNVDADVQTGLGVLFYSMEEYDKTLDCFQAAIRCNPNDALSWNRLGASYANSNRPEQAIEAYSKALQLNPNFVRARYNLGVSFINMGMYKDAVEHLLTGLSMHEVESTDGTGMLVSDTEQSSNLLETLKRAFLAMDRRDLIDKVKPGMNVEAFRKEYNV